MIAPDALHPDAFHSAIRTVGVACDAGLAARARRTARRRSGSPAPADRRAPVTGTDSDRRVRRFGTSAASGIPHRASGIEPPRRAAPQPVARRPRRCRIEATGVHVRASPGRRLARPPARARATGRRRRASRRAHARDGDRRRPPEQRDAERRAQPPAVRQVLLGRHRRADREHPADAARAEREHHAHQHPAAADAKEAVTQAERETVPPRMPASPLLAHEHQRRAALVDATVLERAELIGARERQHGRADEPPMPGEPRRASRERVQAGVARLGEQPERAPCREIAEHDEQHQPVALGPRGRQALEGAQQRQHGRQHHRDDHQQPRGGVQRRRHDRAARRNQPAQPGETRRRPVDGMKKTRIRAAVPRPQRAPGRDDRRDRERHEHAARRSRVQHGARFIAGEAKRRFTPLRITNGT
ncbi:hypothetical protein DM77_2866 [Burkholderia mallei]|nr:hypothetical protein DM77_2866 [Burkholderia mallei]